VRKLKKRQGRELEGLRGKTLTNRMRLSIPVQEMPTQDPQVRRSNMSEVATGYTKSQAMLEAQRCLQCKNAPCVAGCPVRVDIPGFIAKTREGEFCRRSADYKANQSSPDDMRQSLSAGKAMPVALYSG